MLRHKVAHGHIVINHADLISTNDSST